MRAISLWQPWALLWLLSDPDEKVFETRGFYTGYRGPLLVHAAKKDDAKNRPYLTSSGFKEALRRHGLTSESVQFGAIIGRVDLIGCSRMDRMPAPSESEEMWGNWAPDRYAWEREVNPVIFGTPIPYKGQQGFFSVSEEVLENA